MDHIEQCNLYSLHIFLFLDDNLFHALYKIYYLVNKNNDHRLPSNNDNKGKTAKTQNTWCYSWWLPKTNDVTLGGAFIKTKSDQRFFHLSTFLVLTCSSFSFFNKFLHFRLTRRAIFKQSTIMTSPFFTKKTTIIFILKNSNGPFPTQWITISSGELMFHFVAIFWVIKTSQISSATITETFWFSTHDDGFESI